MDGQGRILSRASFFDQRERRPSRDHGNAVDAVLSRRERPVALLEVGKLN